MYRRKAGKFYAIDKLLRATVKKSNNSCRVDRVASEDVTVNGINIPKGMIVNTTIYPVHHDPDYWPEPETYDPERYVAVTFFCNQDKK